MPAARDLRRYKHAVLLETITPDGDTYTTDADALTHGSDTVLKTDNYTLGGQEDLYIKFTLPALAGRTFVNATLRLYATAVGGAATNFRAWRVTAAWNPATLVYATKPTAVQGTATDVNAFVPAVGWNDIDVRDYVSRFYAATAVNNGFSIQHIAGRWQQYNSLEAASNTPQLVLVYS
jgi:hypothetical protein